MPRHAAGAFHISKIGPESDGALRNLFERYIHDMAEWFEIDTKPDGGYSYDTSVAWRKGCRGYLAKVDESIAGSALVGSAAQWLGELRFQATRAVRIRRKAGASTGVHGDFFGPRPYTPGQ